MIALKFARTLAPPLSAAALILATAASALAGVHYVDVNSTNATPPYTNWATAAADIQEAVDAAVAGDEILVTNGFYLPVTVDKLLAIRSVNGAAFTQIYGSGSGRCADLGYAGSLSGFTLANGYLGTVDDSIGGAGAISGTLNSCVLIRNSVSIVSNGHSSPGAYTIRAYGGGAAYCTLNNCTLSGNSASAYVYDAYGYGTESCYAEGGGAYHCVLNNCTLTGNTVSAMGYCYSSGGCAAPFTAVADGAGAAYCTLQNCIAHFNLNAGNYSGCTLNYCCTAPQPTTGIGNITNVPLFLDANAWANLRLQPNSPCINAGNNSYVTNATDLDGNPRISGAVVDIGAYEFQLPRLAIAPSGTNVILSWPITTAGYSAAGFFLQETADLVSSGGWASVVDTNPPVIVNGQILITRPMLGPQWSYRLQQQ